MYINFWYVAAQSHELTTTPVRVTMLGQDFVLFRDSAGAAHCLSNTCTHRGGSLGLGKVVGDTIACSYHGWQFNGGGECVKIPSLGTGGKIPARTRIDAYPVREMYGLVFAFLGDLPEAERPPILDVPEYGQPGWKNGLVTYAHYQAGYERSVENTLDPAHNEFVHPTHGFEGTREDYVAPAYDIDEVPWGCGFMATFQSPALKDKTMNRLRNFDGDLKAGAGHVGPHQTWTQIHMTATNWFHQYTFRTPIDETHTRSWLLNLRNALLDDQHDAAIQSRQVVIQRQDIEVLEAIEPAVPPIANARENLMPADRCIARYRQYCREWDARGWRIDPAGPRRDRGIFAIPSPSRRRVKGWVIDPVPMLGRVEVTE